MAKTLTVFFDGQVFRPETLPNSEPNTHYQITLEPASIPQLEAEKEIKTAWDLLEKYAGTIDAPSDWSEEHDHYLYGTPKRNENKSE